MKKSIYGILICCMTVFVMLAMTSCNNKEAELKQAVEEVNEECPMSLGSFGEMTSVTYEDGNVEFQFAVEEEYIDIDALNSNPELLKESAITMVNNATGDVKTLVDMLESADAGLIFSYKGKDSGKVAKVVLSRKEIEEASNMSAEDKDPMEVLKSQLKVTNAQMPMTIEEGMVMTETQIEGSYVVYKIILDEDLYSIDMMREGYDEAKANIKGELTSSDPVMKQMIDLCKRSNIGIAYRYVGSLSGDYVTIEIPVSEL